MLHRGARTIDDSESSAPTNSCYFILLLHPSQPSYNTICTLRHEMPSCCNFMADVTARPGGIAPPIPSTGSGVCPPVTASWTNNYRQHQQQQIQNHCDYHHLVRMHQEQQLQQQRFVHNRVISDTISNIDRQQAAVPNSEDVSTSVCKVSVNALNGDRCPSTNDVCYSLPQSPTGSPSSLVNAVAGNSSTDATVFRPLSCITPRQYNVFNF